MSAIIYEEGVFPAFGEFARRGTTGSPTSPKPCIAAGLPSYQPYQMFLYGVTLKKAMMAYWVVREYTLEVDLEITFAPDPPFAMVESVIISTFAINEQALVSGPGFTTESGYDVNMFTATSDYLAIDDGGIYGPNLVLSGGSYYPEMYFRFSDGDNNYIFSTHPFNFSGGPLELKEAVFSSDFFGGDALPLYGSAGFTVTGTVTLEPSRYWSHGGTWNEVTGELSNPAGLRYETYIQRP